MTHSDHSPQGRFPRAIRSFVKRQGRMTAGQRRALDEHWADFGIDYTAAPLDPAAAFGRDAPLVLEIGFGNGDNLCDLARRYPEQNFLGIEVHEPGVGACIMNALTHDLANVRVMRHDAVEVLRNMIPDHSLSRVNLFFPDPWHKKRHHKRRIVQRDFVKLLAAKLLPGGIFHVATDWPNYAEHYRPAIEWAKREGVPVSTRFDETVDIVVGSDDDNPARLTSHDWHGATVPWNLRMVRAGMVANGSWAIDVAKAGNSRS